MWYPQNKEELEKVVNLFLKKPKLKTDKIHGIIVPHAGYEFSGAIVGKAFALLPKNQKAIVLGPNHYVGFRGIRSLEKIETPLGKVKISENNYPKLDYEHSIDNQIPFLQKLGFKEILPLVIGQINQEEAKKIAKQLSKEKKVVFIFSTDLSHFLDYELAVKIDKQTINIIENLDSKNIEKIDACGRSTLFIAIELCKLKKYKPTLIEYKNSGNITGDKTSVVGYSSFYF
ncbi:MAG: AmmeMemoRadiSam system protein B [Nanoarchaeota archaeon]|nr:AmmeMemoRadiSam system protein B [Nanoarchaeota archaeon]MBU1028105.1 AmmeMemoRadiSam system protein B [Nanoarchaeota archaeon]